MVAVILIVAVGTPFSIWYAFYHSPQAEAAWWNDLWTYRKSIAVTNSSGSELTDFQVKVLSNVDFSSDITSGKLQADLDDLRFTDINGNTLPYWIEDNTAASVDVWVKAQRVPTSGATIYLYYGNSQATAGSDGKKVFEFFDDFSYGDTTELQRAGWGVSSYTTTTMQSGWVRVQPDNLSDDLVGIKKSTNFGSGNMGNKVYEIRARNSSNQWGPNTRVGNAESEGYNDGTYLQLQRNNPYFLNIRYAGVTRAQTALAGDFNNQIIQTKYSILSDLSTKGGYFNEVTAETKDVTFTTPSSSYSNDNIGLMVHRQSAVDSYVEWDWARVRKYASTEPSSAAPGSEEKGTAPVAYWSFDEGTGTTAQDGTSNNNDGTLTDMSATSDPNSGWQTEDRCVSGKCLAFDGSNDHLELGAGPFSSLPMGDSSHTISLWVKFKSIPTSGDGNVMVNYGTQGSNQERGMMTRDGKLLLFYYSNDWNTNYVPPTNNWLHIVWISSKNENLDKLYVNGSLITSRARGTVNTTSGAQHFIGRYANTYSNNVLDEVKIYGYERTATQIKNDYNAGMTGAGKSLEGISASIGEKSDSWLTQGLIGHWKMDEASWNGTSGEVKDASGSNNNGTASENATTDIGKFSRGGTFDGTGDGVNISSITNNSSTQTAAAWIYVVGAVSGNQYIIDQGDNNNWIQVYNSHVRAGNSGASYCDGSTTLTTNTWYHVAKIFDGSRLKVYLNGNLDCSISGSGNNPGAIRIGDYSSGGYGLNGKIDDVRLYNRALSPQEIQQLSEYAPGPVGYWKLDEGVDGTTKDSSGNSNGGTLTGGPTWKPGKFNNSINFDGSDDFVTTTTNNFGISGNANMSLSAWFKTNSTSTVQTIAVLGDTTSLHNFALVLNNAENGAVSAEFNGGNTYRSAGGMISAGQWYHLEAVKTPGPINTSTKLYLNGREITAISSSTGTPSINVALNYFGVWSNGGLNFNGQIDEVKIYNYARTHKQVIEDMNGGHPAGSSGPGVQVAYWKFDDGNGDSAIDSSGKGHTATLRSGPSWTQEGKIGKALSFMNSTTQYGQYVDNQDSTLAQVDANLKLNGTMTFSMWINPNSTQTAQGTPRIFANGSSGVNHHYIVNLVNLSGGKYALRYAFHNGTTYYTFESSQFLPADSWNHLTVMCKYQAYCSAYLNGNLAGTVNTAYTGDSELTNYFSVGGRSGGYDGIQAKIDEFKIYNYGLSAEDIKADFNQGKSLVLGSTGTADDGKTASFSSARGYCPPGNTEGNCGSGQSPSPVGEWKFDEGTGATTQDSSGNNNIGTFTSGPTWASRGKYGSGINFTGNQYIRIEDNSALDFGTGDYTLSVWVKPSSMAAMTGYERIIRKKSTSSSTGYYIGLDNNSGANTIQCGINDGTWKTAAFGSALSDNTWAHLTCVYSASGSFIKGYLNGTLRGTYSTAIGDVSNDGHLQIAGTADGTDQWEGIIDQVQLYNYAKTQSQVSYDFNRGKPIGWWKFDEGEGNTAYDSSGNSYSATLTDGASYINPAKINTGMDLDGLNDRIQTSTSDPFEYRGGDLTLSTWINQDTTETGAGYIISKPWSGGGQYNYRIYINANDSISLSLLGASAWSTTTTATIPNTTWTHVLVTIEGSSGAVKIYFNGQLVKSDTHNISSWTPSGGDANTSLCIGSLFPYGSGWAGNVEFSFDGKIDDVRFYNYALSAEQVKQAMNDGAVNFR